MLAILNDWEGAEALLEKAAENKGAQGKGGSPGEGKAACTCVLPFDHFLRWRQLFGPLNGNGRGPRDQP